MRRALALAGLSLALAMSHPSIVQAQNVLEITYKSDPLGATLYLGETPFGNTPFTARYTVSENSERLGYIDVVAYRARWSSGATALLENQSATRILLNRGLKQAATFVRPADAPGLDMDLRVAADIVRLEQLRLQAKRASETQTGQRVTVTYNSDPPGAVLYEGTKRIGYAPITGTYGITEEDRARGYKVPDPMEARWASGAVATLAQSGPVRLMLDRGPVLSATFQRPRDFPGLDVDMRFALEVEKNEILRKQGQAQSQLQAQQAAEREKRESSKVWADIINDSTAAFLRGREAQRNDPPPAPSQPPLEMRCQNNGFGQLNCRQK